MGRFILTACLILGPAFLISNCGSGDGGSCKEDKDCKIGTVCELNKCSVKNCTVVTQCGNGQVCLESGACSSPECGVGKECKNGKVCQGGVCRSEQKTCSKDEECQSGQKCKSNVCVAADACTTKADCKTGQTCEASKCKDVGSNTSCASSEQCGNGQFCDTQTKTCKSGCEKNTDCPSTQYCDTAANSCKDGCRVADGCSDSRQCDATTHACKCTQSWCDKNGGGTCDSASGQCKTSAAGFLCKACTTDDECGTANDKCSAIGAGSFCTKACTTQADCPTGFACYEITNESKQCVPLGFNCAGCVVDGCSNPNETCDYQSNDGQCIAKKSTCDSCTLDYECGDNGACYQNAGNERYCTQRCDSASCATGFNCKSITIADGGQLKVCVPTTTGEKCNLCSGVTCTGNTPICNQNKGTCVECNEAKDCTNGKTCDAATNKCVEGQTCSDPFPIFISGQGCVQCQFDPDCKDFGGGKCDKTSYSCIGGTTQTGTCTKDADCPGLNFGGVDTTTLGLPGNVSLIPMSCDQGSGKCYEPSGFCASNADCFSGSNCNVNAIVGLGICTCNLFAPACAPSQVCDIDELSILFGGLFPTPRCLAQ